MVSKALVIKVKPGSEPQGTPEKWEDLTGEMERVTRDIETQALKEEASNIGALVSGIPTPFARANMFKDALNSNGEGGTSENLTNYYASLVKEWRGFIACIALDYSRIDVKRVWLVYSDGKSLAETVNIYEPCGAFGNMLFGSKPLWCEADADEEHKGKPFIDIIRYDGTIVGGTSPESLLFTSVAYQVNDRKGKPYVDFETGKFTDPLKHNIDYVNTLVLYAYVKRLIESIPSLANYYSYLRNNPETSRLVPNYANLQQNLQEWQEEIGRYAIQKGFKNLEGASTPSINKFGKPFAEVFNYTEELFYNNGVLSSKDLGNNKSFDPKELLLKGSDAEIARLAIGANKDNIDKLPVYVMRATVKDDPNAECYFSLPLTPLGLEVFGERIKDLINTGVEQTGDFKSRLTAVYDPISEKNNLEVNLHLEVDQIRERDLKETYTVTNTINTHEGNEIIMWPNFIAKEWHRYFLYSEIPHNATTGKCYFKAVPFAGDELQKDFNIICGKDGEPFYLAKDGIDQDLDFEDEEGHQRHLETTLHVVSGNAVNQNDYKYEIYECDHPFKGLKLISINNKCAGFLIIRYTQFEAETSLPKNRLDLRDGLREVNLGVDFGSTNTSIAFCREDGTPEGLDFVNRRVPLLRVTPINEDDVATENRLFFFQSNPKKSNSIKSVLTIHDSRRILPDKNENAEQWREKAVKGGFPCFCNNLPVDDVQWKFIKLNGVKCGPIDQIQNMKWDDNQTDVAYKKAFLQSLLLHVYAELLDKGLMPKRLRWSFPSSMSAGLISTYQQIWDSLKDMNPLSKNGRYDLEVSQPPYALANAPAASNNPNPDFAAGNSFLAGNPLLAGSVSTGFDNSNNSFANNPMLNMADAGGLNANKENQEPDFHRDNDDEQISFAPVKLIDNNVSTFYSMTEACAVANYLQRNNELNVGDSSTLTLCFDIGGSTTDISVLCWLEQGLTMIKQSSIRFAAQRVSGATRKSQNFENVLKRICDQYGYRIQGLNQKPYKYTAEMAPYYFEQVVDRLKPEELKEFYRLISSDCKDLMCVDLYVTGLILYYAGILVRKLIKQVRNSKECAWRGGKQAKPIVNIAFAGKGARIMEWLSVATNPQFAEQYYQAMFIKGMGQQDAGNYISNLKIVFPKNVSDKVKYEVSMGLAATSSVLLQPSELKPIEIIGETGFEIRNRQGEFESLDSDNSITEQMMKYIGNDFRGSSCAGDRFKDFCGMYYKVAQQYFGLRMTPDQFNRAWENMNMVTYIKNTPEYQKAAKAQSFDYVAPVLILEGMRFYDEFLLK